VNLVEAMELAIRHNAHKNTVAEVVRILPLDQDPVVPGDNGWDVLVRWSDPKGDEDEVQLPLQR
jgi:hypothetical protein